MPQQKHVNPAHSPERAAYQQVNDKRNIYTYVNDQCFDLMQDFNRKLEPLLNKEDVELIIRERADTLGGEIASDVNMMEKGIAQTNKNFENFQDKVKKALFELEKRLEKIFQ